MATPPDFTAGQVLTAAQMNAIGAWVVQSKNVSAASVVQFDQAFTTDFDSYFLVGTYLHNTTAGNLNFTLQDVSNNSVANNYNGVIGGGYTNAGTPTFGGFNAPVNAASLTVCASVAADYGSFQMTIQAPRRAVKTQGVLTTQAVNWSATLTNVFVTGGFSHTLATAYYGCRLTPAAGTVTGQFTLYGLND